MAEKELGAEVKEALNKVEEGSKSNSEDLLPSSEENSWESLLGGDDESEEIVGKLGGDEKVSVEAAAPAEPVQDVKEQVVEEPAESAEKAAEPEVPTVAAVESKGTPPAEVKSEPAPPKQPVESPEELAEKRRKWREDSEKRLAEIMAGQLSQEDVEALRIEPEKVLPKVLAKASMDMYDAVVSSVVQRIPTMFSELEMQRRQAQEAEEAFFKAWPQLRDPKYKEVLDRTVAVYRQVNPQAPLEQAIQEVGVMASVALRLPIAGAEKPVEAAPARQKRVEPQKPAYVPASPGAGGSPVPKSNAQANAFAKLAEDFFSDDE